MRHDSTCPADSSLTADCRSDRAAVLPEVPLGVPWSGAIFAGRKAKPRALFICGSRNQTTQLHQVARAMPDFDQGFSPYFVTGAYEWARELGALDFTIAGGHWRDECLEYLRSNKLPIDVRGHGHEYDLVVTCQDLFVSDLLRTGIEPIGAGHR